jgi:hypothetical protein
MKIFFKYLILLLGLFLSINVLAQTNKKAYNDSYKEFSLRTSLTSFFDYDAGIMLGVNYRWSEHLSASFEPTWIFYNGFITAGENKIFPTGIKIRADLRYHFEKRKSRSPDFFVAPEFHYKYTKTEKEDRFGINCQNGQCAYFQDAVYTDIKNEVGGQVKLGMITPFPFVKNEKWLLEFYTGFGAKILTFREENLPLGGSFVNPPDRTFLNFGNPTSRNTSNRPMLPAGLKLIFVL